MNRRENEEESLLFILIIFLKLKIIIIYGLSYYHQPASTPILSSFHFLLFDFIFSYFGYKQSYFSKILMSIFKKNH